MTTGLTPDLITGMIGSVAYFVLGLAVLGVGFVVLDLLTPGKLRELVFVHHLPNATLLAAAQQVALGIIVVSAITHSPQAIVPGLIVTASYSMLALILQAVAFVILELITPGNVRAMVEDPKLRGGAVSISVTVVIVAVINAACMS